MDRIDLRKLELVEETHFFNSKSKNDSDVKATHKSAFVNKVKKYNLEDIKELYETYIERKYKRIVRSKKMIATIRKLQKVCANL